MGIGTVYGEPAPQQAQTGAPDTSGDDITDKITGTFGEAAAWVRENLVVVIVVLALIFVVPVLLRRRR